MYNPLFYWILYMIRYAYSLLLPSAIFFERYAYHRDLHSFPTRRSSDLYPRARVTSLVPFLFFFPARLPAWVVLGSWFVLQYFYASGASVANGAGVAYLAHVVGFIAGIVLIIVLGGLSRRRRPPPTWQRWQTPYR